jgi:hypothetical protein
MSQQGARQAVFRSIGGTTGTYEQDAMAAFAAQGVTNTGPFNARFLDWLNIRLGATYTSLPGAMAAYAAREGVHNWESLGDELPVFDWDFARLALPSGLTLSRADASTCATHIGSDGLLKTVAANIARYEHVSVTGAFRGLLAEPSRTNIALHARDLTNAAWVKTSTTAAREQIGVDGTANSASLLTATAGNGTCLQSVTIASASRITSCYIKRSVGTGNIDMTTNGGTNWTTVTVTSGYTRVWCAPQTVTNPSIGFRIVTSGDAVIVDYVQNEAVTAGQTGVTSAIATTTAAVTRAADDFAFNPTAVGFNATQGTWLVHWYNRNDGTQVALITSDLVTDYTQISQASATLCRCELNTGAGAQCVIDLTASPNFQTFETLRKVAFAYKANDFAASLNGGTVGTDTAGTIANAPASTGGTVGSQGGGSFGLTGTIPRIAYYNKRLANARLQALTA